jgi:arylformamidase
MKMLFSLIAILLSATACKKDVDTVENPPSGNPAYTKVTVQYNNLSGVNANLLSLDIYHFGQSGSPKPVIIWVHGGGWRVGDKTNGLTNKLNLFNAEGYIFVSVNYRLSPDPLDINNPNRIMYPVHNNDVADAVKWVYDNIATYGGNKLKMALLGHSAGAHLVSLTGTGNQFLPAKGLPLNTLKGVASFDTEGYDVTQQSGEGIYMNAFGTDPAIWPQASPTYNVSNGTAYPKFFIAKRGDVNRIAIADAFINKLTLAGTTVSQVTASQYDHEDINSAIGYPGETAVTEPLKAFFKQCFQ